MTNKYRVALSDGRAFIVEVEGDQPPSEADVLAKLGEPSPVPPAKTPTRDLTAPERTTGKAETISSGSGPASRFLGGMWEGVNPFPALAAANTSVAKAIQYGLSGLPIEGAQSLWNDVSGLVKGTAAASSDELTKAQAAANAGDYTRAIRHLFGMAPMVGPYLSRQADKMESGDIAGGLGGSVGMVIGLVGPGKVKGAKVFPALKKPSLTPVEASAVAFGESRGIPMDAGTVTGSQFVRNVQKRVSGTLGGANTAENFKAAQAAKLEAVADDLASQSNQGGRPMVPVTAGEGVRDTLTQQIQRLKSEADTAYGALRQFEAQAPAQTRNPHPGAPVQSMRLAVDTRPAKSALVDIYQRLKRESELTALQSGSGKAKALTALDRLMNGPDFAPLSIVDGVLSELKSLARGAEMPELRTSAQGIAAKAVQQLDAQVKATAAQAGPDVLGALMEGRAATRQKWGVADVLDTLSTEPRRVFDQLTARKDGGVELLQSVQRVAPNELPNIGRAFLEEMIAKATAEGGFGHADALWSQWQKAGPRTRAMLFPHGLPRQLDDFFLLAKKLSENPNPSGTAQVLNATQVLASVPSYAIAKLLYTPKGIQLLTQGLRLGTKAERAAWTAAVARAAGASSSDTRD